MFRKLQPWVCAGVAVGAPAAMLALGCGEAAAFAAAGVALASFGEASPWLVALGVVPLFQLLPGDPPANLAEAMAAAGVAGPGTIAADPAALWIEMRALAGCFAVFALARTAAGRSQAAAWWALAGVAAFGCYEGALGVASGVGATPASGTLVHRGQYAALLELTFGAGCGLAAAAWAGRAWSERLEDKALLGAALGLAAAGLSLAGIGLSLSRTGIVAGGLGAVIAAAWFGRKNAWALGAAALVTIGLVLGAPRALDRFEELAAARGDPGRRAVWADSLELAGESWLTGVGFGSYPSAFRRSSFYLPRKSVDNAHSDYLEWLVELGAPAAGLMLGALAYCLLGAIRGARKSPLAAGCAIGVGAVLLHAAVDLPLQRPGLAALTAAMFGLSSGIGARHGAPGTACAHPVCRSGGARALGVLAIALALTPLETPQQLYLAAGAASAQGDPTRAAQLYESALDRNLLAAPAWLRLAEIERSNGNSDRAILFLEAAREIEPFTLRTEWPLAEIELERGETASAMRRLGGLVAAAPDLLDAALHTASRSGVDPNRLQRLVPREDPEAAGRYLAFLARSENGDRLPEAYASLGAPELPQLYRDWLAREADFQP